MSACEKEGRSRLESRYSGVNLEIRVDLYSLQLTLVLIKERVAVPGSEGR